MDYLAAGSTDDIEDMEMRVCCRGDSTGVRCSAAHSDDVK
jgi:hypothetical protein